MRLVYLAARPEAAAWMTFVTVAAAAGADITGAGNINALQTQDLRCHWIAESARLCSDVARRSGIANH